MKKKENKKDSGYGLLSMMAMIIGIVIGAGIFVKNASLISINGSVLLTVIAWTVGALIVLAIIIAFFEIISITEITSEQATMSNWGRHLCGVRFGKFVGYFFTFTYFPIIMASLFMFAGNQFMDALYQAGIIKLSLQTDWKKYYGYTIAVGAFFITIITLMNAFSKRPGKYLQNIGTAIKTIPLFFLIILLIVMVFANIGKINFSVPKNIKPKESNNSLVLVFMTMPAILFSFDGFILGGSLSKEAKSEGTFKLSFVLSMIFIIVIYVLFSVAVFGLSDKSKPETYGTISNAIYAVMPKAGKIIAPIVVFIIFISVITGVSGVSITCSRMLSDLSVHNSILDKNGRFITKNKAGVSSAAGLYVFGATFMWFVICAIFDGWSIMVAQNIDEAKKAFLSTAGYMSNLIVVGGFVLYSIIMGAGFVNRFTKKAKVKKNKMFIPAAFIASLLTFVITIYFAWNTVIPKQNEMPAIFWSHLIFFILFVLNLIVVCIWNSKRTKNLEKDVTKIDIFKLKEEKVKNYYK